MIYLSCLNMVVYPLPRSHNDWTCFSAPTVGAVEQWHRPKGAACAPQKKRCQHGGYFFSLHTLLLTVSRWCFSIYHDPLKTVVPHPAVSSDSSGCFHTAAVTPLSAWYHTSWLVTQLNLVSFRLLLQYWCVVSAIHEPRCCHTGANTQR